MEYGIDELPDSYFSKSSARVDNGKDGVLPLSNFVVLIETLGEDFHSEELEVHLQKLDPK